ncbi:MAG: KpsF/GutQ family sugar-phosphate isomerase [Alphaproteobacteria bacterium]|nr:KpsF/GutQ family sugar-phosphate isomerase [Alphaproteobacteria bacterium]
MALASIKTSENPILAEARRVLLLESDALKMVSHFLDASFAHTIDLLKDIKGRIILTGMGKSGHIAKKIAATLASTGNASYFVHSSEASHGDLGMITNEDAVIALSYSGETIELSNIIAYTKRYSVPLIAITGSKESALSQSATYALILPKVEEACPHGLAPTTSTTMMLALGDAIAITLMAQKNFTADHFRVFHPGGALGKKLIKVRDLMEEAPLVEENTLMQEAILVMTQKRKGCVGIINNVGQLKGIITDGDLRRHLSPDLLNQKANLIMNPNPRVIKPDVLAVEALKIMNDSKITSLFVAESKILGIIHIHDCLKAGIA